MKINFSEILNINNKKSENINFKKIINELVQYNPKYIDQSLKRRISKDLLNNNSLIPYEGVLGGNPGFYIDNEIFLIENKTVVACWSDGHIGGFMILQYDIDSFGNFKWKVLDGFLDSPE